MGERLPVTNNGGYPHTNLFSITRKATLLFHTTQDHLPAVAINHLLRKYPIDMSLGQFDGSNFSTGVSSSQGGGVS